MMILVAALSVVMGLTLGLLGGGGSILTVPILVYALGMDAKEAIATSLLVVGLTSLVGALKHARAGNVRYRTGFLFGAVAMIGAFSGGLVAGSIDGKVLLLLFVALMAVTGAMMLRRRQATRPECEGAFRPLKIVVEGFVVGAVTGLVGAGGGFLVVPALLLLGGLPMRAAVGTSLLVISLKSFAGLAGHLSHVSIDLQVAAMVSGLAVVGALIGAWLANRVPPAKLRRAFAVFVLMMAVFMFFNEAPASWKQAIFEDRWPFWAGGLAIGLFVVLLLVHGGRRLGVSTGYMDVCAAPYDQSARRSWRWRFMIGIILGGVAAAVLSGGIHPTTQMGLFDALVTASPLAKAGVFLGGGVLLGFGARLAGGCTSGHGIVGMAQMARSSMFATASFMVAGFVVTFFLLNS